MDGRGVEESGQACKRLLRLTKDDYLWFMMTKRLVKRERAERWRKQAHERREQAQQLKRRLSSGLGCKHGRTDEAAAQEGEQMEMEDKPDAPEAPVSSSAHPPMAHDDDGAHDEDEGDGDYECGCAEKEEAAVSGAGVGRRKMRSAAGPAEERRRKMKAQMQTYDLRKPGARDWKWVYRCKTVPAPALAFARRGWPNRACVSCACVVCADHFAATAHGQGDRSGAVHVERWVVLRGRVEGRQARGPRHQGLGRERY